MLMKVIKFQNNTGAALVTVIMVVFIIMAIITDLTINNLKTIRRLQNRQLNEQSSMILDGAIDFGRAALTTSGATSKIDTLKDIWAAPLPRLKLLNDIWMSGQVIDEQSKFNINDLVENGQVNEEVVKQFMRLLSYLNLPQNMAYNIAYYMADPQYQEAIMMQYTMGTPAYRPAGRTLIDLSELTLVKGVEPLSVYKLSKYVMAIPVTRVAVNAESAVAAKLKPKGLGMAINVNTASAEVIAAKSGVDLAIAQRMISQRDLQPFNDKKEIETFLTSNGVTIKKPDIANPNAVDINSLTVESKYFTVHAVVDYEDNQFLRVALLERSSRGGQWPKILWRHPE